MLPNIIYINLWLLKFMHLLLISCNAFIKAFSFYSLIVVTELHLFVFLSQKISKLLTYLLLTHFMSKYFGTLSVKPRKQCSGLPLLPYATLKLEVILQETADLVTFTKEILNGKLHFLFSYPSFVLSIFDLFLTTLRLVKTANQKLRFLYWKNNLMH